MWKEDPWPNEAPPKNYWFLTLKVAALVLVTAFTIFHDTHVRKEVIERTIIKAPAKTYMPLSICLGIRAGDRISTLTSRYKWHQDPPPFDDPEFPLLENHKQRCFTDRSGANYNRVTIVGLWVDA